MNMNALREMYKSRLGNVEFNQNFSKEMIRFIDEWLDWSEKK